jgi:hypothetical protein
MAFERLEALGGEQFTKILNALMRGEPAMRLARTIQQQPPDGWGLFQDVAEKTLTQQLNRLRQAAAEGAFGLKRARSIAAGNTPQLKMLEHVSVRVIERLEQLSDLQQERVHMLMAKEREVLLPKENAKMAPQEYRHLLTQTNMVFNDYKQLLMDIQKVRFDLGLDEFKGPVSGSVTAIRGAIQSTTLPDGTNVQRQVYEAVTTAEQIFNARKIPQLVAR